MKGYSVAESKLIDFARDYSTIEGISLGCCPEESKIRVYYFLLRGEILDEARSDAISKLEIGLTNRERPLEQFALAEWPADAYEGHRFLGEVIWRKTTSEKV